MNFLNNLTQLQKILVAAIGAVIVFGASAAVSYSAFSGTNPISGTTASNNALPTVASTGGQNAGENPGEAKTEACPLNGTMHTKEAKAAWAKQRPLAVMIENHTDARPQSGLSSADVVYETVAEGGITRFMALFYCNSLADIEVGPVRSARTYFIDWLSEYDALYAHVGGANTPGPADALGQIITYGIKDLNQFSIGFPTYWRDYQRVGRTVATEHTMYSSTQKLWTVGDQRGWTNVDSTTGKAWDSGFTAWKFKEDQSGGTVTKITVPFWQGYGDYTVQWDYNQQCNCYKRANGYDGTKAPIAHIDFDNKQQLSPKNIVVQYEEENHAHDGYEADAHLLYTDKGTGKAVIFQDGKAIVGTWSKATRTSREKFFDGSGAEIAFNRGQIWIETVPIGSTATY
jgi:hypothetical protein